MQDVFVVESLGLDETEADIVLGTRQDADRLG
jgi:hypothetical protein